MTPVVVLLINAAASWFLTGLIWIVQLVHYPLFPYVDRTAFPAFAAAHSRAITPIVGPVMLVELVTAVLLVANRPAALPVRWAWIGVGLVGVIWLSTALVQVPLHGQLGQGYDARAHGWLVTSNWIRTVAWSIRSLLLLLALTRALQSSS